MLAHSSPHRPRSLSYAPGFLACRGCKVPDYFFCACLLQRLHRRSSRVLEMHTGSTCEAFHRPLKRQAERCAKHFDTHTVGAYRSCSLPSSKSSRFRSIRDDPFYILEELLYQAFVSLLPKLTNEYYVGEFLGSLDSSPLPPHAGWIRCSSYNSHYVGCTPSCEFCRGDSGWGEG